MSAELMGDEVKIFSSGVHKLEEAMTIGRWSGDLVTVALILLLLKENPMLGAWY